MVAKIALDYKWLGRIDVTLDYKVAIIGNIDVVCDALDKFYRLSAKETRQQIFIQIVGHRCCCGVCIGRVTTDGNRYGHTLAQRLITVVVARSRLVTVPMHTRCLAVKYLHTVHSDIAQTTLRVECIYHRQGDKTTTIAAPTLENRQYVERCTIARQHHLLALSSALELLWKPTGNLPK